MSNSLTFALGPGLLDGEDTPDEEEEDDKKQDDQDANGSGEEGADDVEQGRFKPAWLANGDDNGLANEDLLGHATQDDGEEATEDTSLLPDTLVRHADAAGHGVYKEGKKGWDKLPHWTQDFLVFMYAFLNGPLIGALIGAVVGIVPQLHRAFFSDQANGGIFTAWLTSSLSNVGGLFASLQVVVVGVKLSGSLRKMKRGEDSGTVPWVPMFLVLGIRFVVWPL